ncbi:MAG: SHOCT domain-containing protein [Bacillota bacterium]
MIFLIIMILVVVYLYNNGDDNFLKKENQKSEALERLKKRYVDGEISESKYLEMKKNIK